MTIFAYLVVFKETDMNLSAPAVSHIFILYIFLSGSPPFNGPNDSDIFQKIA